MVKAQREREILLEERKEIEEVKISFRKLTIKLKYHAFEFYQILNMTFLFAFFSVCVQSSCYWIDFIYANYNRKCAGSQKR